MTAVELPSGDAPQWRQPDTVRTRQLITPEGIDLRLQLAAAGERTAAFCIDLAIITGLLIGGTLVIVVLAILSAGSQSLFSANQLLLVLWLLGSFFLRNFYFMVFESRPRCATPGKRAVGIRVVNRTGGALDFDAIFARNAMRELELFLPLSFVLVYGRDIGGWGVLAGFVWCAIFALFPFFNHDCLRVGDFVAGTWVIRAPRRVLEPDLLSNAAAQTEYVFTTAEVDAYGVKELTVLEEVLRRGNEPTMQLVASRIRKKIGRQVLPSESDRKFLDAYYSALRRRLETRLLFGHRRRDKFDRA